MSVNDVLKRALPDIGKTLLEEHEHQMRPLHESIGLASSSDFVVRPATGDDLNYVRKTWLREYADEALPSLSVQGISKEVYDHEHKLCLEEALRLGAVTIACRASVPDGICGFAVTEARTVHFVFVKGRWRQLGVAKLLLKPFLDAPAIYTHRTNTIRALRVPEAWTFNPYQFFRTT